MIALIDQNLSFISPMQNLKVILKTLYTTRLRFMINNIFSIKRPRRLFNNRQFGPAVFSIEVGV